MEIKQRKDITLFDLERIESPSSARDWIERNVDLNPDSNGFGVDRLMGLADAVQCIFNSSGGGQELVGAALQDLLAKIELCEAFLVHCLGSTPMEPLAIPGPKPRTFEPNGSLRGDARDAAKRLIQEARENDGTYAAPTLATKEPTGVTREQPSQRKGTGVALLPGRYAVAPKKEGEEAYSYSHSQLRTDLPELKQGRYVIRALRAGFLYVFFEGNLESFSVSANGRIRRVPRRQQGSIVAHEDALIFPGDGKDKEAMIAFSGHPWTKAQRDKIINNENGCRASQMQAFPLEAPEQDAVPLADLATIVEEYAGRAKQYEWSEYRCPNRDARERMDSVNKKAGAGQHIVVLHDPVAITHELGSFFEQDLERLRKYVSEPDDGDPTYAHERYRKKVIATAIERIYESHFAKHYYKDEWSDNPNASGEYKAVVREIEEEQDRLETQKDYVERFSASEDQGPSAARWKSLQERTERNLESLYAKRKRLIEEGKGPPTAAQELDRIGAERRAGREEDASGSEPVPPASAFRREALADDDVNPGIERLTKHIHEKERQTFLNTYEKVIKLIHRDILERKADRHQWLSTWKDKASSDCLGSAWSTYDFDDKEEGTNQFLHYEASFAASIRGATAVSLSEEELEEEPEFQLIGEWLGLNPDESPLYRAIRGHTEFRNTVAGVKDRVGQLDSGSAALIEELYKILPVTVPTEEIVRNTVNYVLNKPKNWNGAIPATMDEYIGRMLGADPDKAGELLLELMIRHGQHFEFEKKPVETFTRNLVDASRNPGIQKEIEEMVRKGTLDADGVSQIQVTDLTSRTAETALGKTYPNPMLGWGSAGVSSLVGLLNIANVNMALDQFDRTDPEQVANSLSALCSMGAAINDGLNTYSTALPDIVGADVASSRLAGFLTSAFAARLFGHGGALLTGLTMLFKAHESASDGDWDAGLFYAASGATAVAGGVILTEVTAAALEGVTFAALGVPVIGWIALGIVLVGASVWLLWEAEDAIDTEVQRWLDAGTFGNHDRTDAKPYKTLEEEQETMVYALYAPKELSRNWDDRWGWEHYFAHLEVLLPAYQEGESKCKVRANGHPLGNGVLEPGQGGMVAKYKYDLRKDKGSEVVFRFEYRPGKKFGKDIVVEFTLPEQEKDN